MNDESEKFLCPECGTTDSSEIIYVTTTPHDADPWSSVPKRLTCSGCSSIVPAHLAERRDDISIEAAQKEWRETYRASQPR